MKVLIFGATGMVGQGVLRECLRAPDVEAVQTVGRTRTGQLDPRLVELILPDLMDYRAAEPSLKGFDACFFCLGVSSAGIQEADYARLTYDLTLAAAETLARLNPQMTFVYVSGAGTDSTERGRSMWARVKGRTENALQPPKHGEQSARPSISPRQRRCRPFRVHRRKPERACGGRATLRSPATLRTKRSPPACGTYPKV